ncbi:MAG: aminomethyl-transferring glycine dehydrogenase subunit GcvPA [Muribaculaceae bacterium]
MAYKYFPHTEADIQAMLARIGVTSLDDLYSDVPECIRFRKEYNLPEAKSELEIREMFTRLADNNKQLTCFAGAGVYDHYTPAVIPSIVERSEFLTSYTPYQAEISQGTLHYIFEFQSMMAELTGMAISNASMYDGSTATAEAVLMAKASAKKANKVLVSSTVDPRTLNVILTYAHFHGVEIELIDANNGATDLNDMQARLDAGGVAGVVMQQPNRYGIVEDFTGVADACHDHKALFVINSVAADLALLRTPGEWGADIAVGDVQSLGVPMSFGGPYAGYMCCTEKLLRKLPGRIVGRTQDTQGRRCFVLTLQAREQHIRREKATSNICSNQSLMALWVTIYMSLMGKNGIKEAAQLSLDGAHYMQEQLIETGLFTPTFNQPFFNEFCLDYKGNVDELQQHLINNGVLGGVKISDHTIMFAVTERRSKEEIDRVVSLIKQF